MRDVRHVEQGRNEWSSELGCFMDDEIGLPLFGDRKEIVEHRRGGDHCEPSREHVRRQLFGCQRLGLREPLEVRRPQFGGDAATWVAGNARSLDDVDSVGSRGPSHLVAQLRQALRQRNDRQHVAHRRRRRHEDPHRPVTLGGPVG
jgi:hypothetical protein